MTDETIDCGARGARRHPSPSRRHSYSSRKQRQRPMECERAVHKRRRKLSDDGRRLSRAARLARPDGRHLSPGSVQREPLRVVAGGQARNRGSCRHVEVLLRQVLDLLHVLQRRVPDPERNADHQQPSPGLRLRLDRHAADATELDRHDRPQRRLRHQGTRVPDHAAVQLVLRRHEAPSRRRDRRVLQRRPGPHTG